MTCGTYLRLARSYQCLIRSTALSSVPQRIVAVRTNARRKALAHSLADPTQRLQRVPARVLRCGISHSPPEPLTIMLHQASTEGVREYASTGSTLTDLACGLPTQLWSPWDGCCGYRTNRQPSAPTGPSEFGLLRRRLQCRTHGPRRVGLGFVAHLVHSAAVTHANCGSSASDRATYEPSSSSSVSAASACSQPRRRRSAGTGLSVVWRTE